MPLLVRREFGEPVQSGPSISGLQNNPERHNSSENHKLGVQQNQNTSMVKIPALAHAAQRLHHSPAGERHSKNLPVRAMQIIDIWKAGQTQADQKRTESE